MSKILMVASEATPFAKTGGLADVIGALPAALVEQGEQVAVLLPLYRDAVVPETRREVYRNFPVALGAVSYSVDFYEVIERGVRFLFADCPPLFDRDGLYGAGGTDFPDNAVRFGVFSRAALGVIKHLFRPDVVHCHDWQTALVPVYLRSVFANDPAFLHLKTLFTIHNLGYQGVFPPETLPQLGLDRALLRPDYMEFFGSLNLMKGALAFSDAVSTVSKAYAREILTPELGFGLDGFLRTRAARVTGILNGVDYSEWSPEVDRFIAANYSAADLAGKRECKRDLLSQFGLPTSDLERPCIGIVSRFVNQKGFDLIAAIAPELVKEDIYLTALGSGAPEFEKLFRDLAEARPDRFAVQIGYDNPLAHRIEAGADLFLMPSAYEPCGLNQIYSLRYGTVPVVRATGGLDDTVDAATGFKFKEYSGAALLRTLREALALYRTRRPWEALARHGMAQDHSWRASAMEYVALYQALRIP